MHVGVWFCTTGDHTVVCEVTELSEGRSDADSADAAAVSTWSSNHWAAQDGTVGFVLQINPDREPVAPSAGPSLFALLCLIDVWV